MSDDYLIPVGLGAAAIWWLSRDAAGGTWTPGQRSAGARAAIAELPLGPCGVPASVSAPAGLRGGNVAASGRAASWLDAWGLQRRAMVDARGALLSGRPRVAVGCLRELCDGWIRAADALDWGVLGADTDSAGSLWEAADRLDAARGPDDFSGDGGKGEALRAVAALRFWRATLDGMRPEVVDAGLIDATFDLTRTVASRLDSATRRFGAGAVAEALDDLRDDLTDPSRYAGAVGSAARAVVKVAGSVALDAVRASPETMLLVGSAFVVWAML